jgi:hypothetical protein
MKTCFLVQTIGALTRILGERSTKAAQMESLPKMTEEEGLRSISKSDYIVYIKRVPHLRARDYCTVHLFRLEHLPRSIGLL